MIFKLVLWMMFTWAYEEHFGLCRTKKDLLQKILFYIIISFAILG